MIPKSLKNEVLNKYIGFLENNNCKIINIDNDPLYLNGEIRPICFLEFIYEEYIYLTILEIDFNGGLSAFRINNTYEKLYKEKGNFNEFRGEFPILIIASEKKNIRYNSKNFEVIYTDLDLLNLEYFLF
jgi:hypothetical protein